jgi:MarR family transcriptional regulator for hemolysin
MNFDRTASTGYMTNWAARLFAKAIDLKLKPLGLSAAYMPVFFALVRGEELSQSALTAAAAVEQPTMAGTLKRMERDGLLEKRPDPTDGRAALYRLSARGREMSARVREFGQSIHAAALSGLSEEEASRMLAALASVVGNLERWIDDNRPPREG